MWNIQSRCRSVSPIGLPSDSGYSVWSTVCTRLIASRPFQLRVRFAVLAFNRLFESILSPECALQRLKAIEQVDAAFRLLGFCDSHHEFAIHQKHEGLDGWIGL